LANLLALPTTLDDHLYQYAIVSGNLDMPAGKLAAQAGHAFGDSFAQAQQSHPQIARDYRNPQRGGSKVVLRAKNQQHLINAYVLARELGLPCALVVDQHHILPPHFNGQPIITALGLGPCTKDQARAVTKKFQCV